MQLTIAIIDDDDEDVLILKQALAELIVSARALAWYDPVEAINSLTATHCTSIPSHIFVDFNMPVLNGKECVRALRSDIRYNDSVITVVSSTLTAQDTHEFEALGANYVF